MNTFLKNEKVIRPDELQARVEKIKASGKTIVTLNGSFDLLHAGHLFIIHEAKKQADVLIIALNSDVSIKQYKSPTRPIISLDYRIELISALEDVDFVTWFDDLDPRNVLDIIRPSVHVNGAEYGKDCIEAQVVRQHGGEIHIVSLKPGLSTSNIIEKIKLTCV